VIDAVLVEEDPAQGRVIKHTNKKPSLVEKTRDGCYSKWITFMQSTQLIIDDHNPNLETQSQVFQGLSDEGKSFLANEDLKDERHDPSFLTDEDHDSENVREHWPSALTPELFLNHDEDRVDLMWDEASPLRVIEHDAFFGYYDEFCRYFKNTKFAERKGYDKSWFTGETLWEERKL
jgi:hypothetical protein